MLAAELLRDLNDWCKREGEREWTATGLGRALPAHGAIKAEKKSRDGWQWTLSDVPSSVNPAQHGTQPGTAQASESQADSGTRAKCAESGRVGAYARVHTHIETNPDQPGKPGNPAQPQLRLVGDDDVEVLE